MSRIGKNPIGIPQGVEVKLDGNVVTVKGPKGELTQTLSDGITMIIEDGQITLDRASEAKEHKAKHGLNRSLINNMIVGVCAGKAE